MVHAILVIYVGFCCTPFFSLFSRSPSPLLFATSCLLARSLPSFCPAFQVPTPFRSLSRTSFSLSETNTVFLLAHFSCCKSSNGHFAHSIAPSPDPFIVPAIPGHYSAGAFLSSLPPSQITHRAEDHKYVIGRALRPSE